MSKLFEQRRLKEVDIMLPELEEWAYGKLLVAFNHNVNKGRICTEVRI